MAPAMLSQARRAVEAALAEAVTRPSTPSPTSTSTPTPKPEDDTTIGLGDAPGDSNGSSLTSNTTTIVLIVVIVLCGAAIMSAAIFYLFDRRKNHQFREACKRDPYLTRKEFARRRKLSALERLEEEELQRSVMIRKSLASRNTHSRTPSSESLSDDAGDFEMARHQQRQLRRMSGPPYGGGGYRYDELHSQHNRSCSSQTLQPGWTPGETRRLRSDSDSESTLSGSPPPPMASRYAEPHPGVEVEIPLPPQSRTPSPTRTPLIGRKPVPPPAVHREDRPRRHSWFPRSEESQNRTFFPFL